MVPGKLHNTVSGKGLISYTEYYLRDYTGANARYHPNVADDLLDELNALALRGADCSRYTDLRLREITHFQDLQLDFVILGFGAASWYNVERRPDTYTWRHLDRWIGRVQAAGIGVVLQLWGTPTWASGVAAPSNCDTYVPQLPYPSYDSAFYPYNLIPQDISRYVGFVKRVADRYNGNRVSNPFDENQMLHVSVFSLWNEPNIYQFWDEIPTNTTGRGGMDPRQLETFIQMHNDAYDAIHDIRSDPVTVWGVNLLGNYANDGYTNPVAYMQAAAGRFKFDVFAVHPYPINFDLPPTHPANSIHYAIGNVEALIAHLDQYYGSPPLALTEIGYRSDLGYGVSTGPDLKATYLDQTLVEINRLYQSYPGRILAVANNTLYNAWRWWKTGLIDMDNAEGTALTFNRKEPAYTVFKHWELHQDPITRDIDAAHFGMNNSTDSYSIIKGDAHWHNPDIIGGAAWTITPLAELYQGPVTGPSGTPTVPTSHIDAAYFGCTDHIAGYTVIKGDRYWFRPQGGTTWYTNTLTSAYQPIGEVTPPLPTANIDAAFFTCAGDAGFRRGFTVIKGDRYWFRPTGSAQWQTDTLAALFAPLSADVPTANIDTAYIGNGGFTVIKGDRYWFRTSPAGTWYTNTLESAYR